MGFKGTKGEWEVVEHNWSDTSLICGYETIATISISEDSEEYLQSKVEANFKLLSKSLKMLEKLDELQSLMEYLDEWAEQRKEINDLIGDLIN